MLPLIGVGVIVLGFALRFNPLLVVVCAAMASGLAAGLGPLEVLAAFGKAFNQNRYVSIVWVILPAIGVLERSGLQERARTAVRAMKAATAGRILVVYLLARQLTAALGLISIAGHAQTVRPLVAPMAEAAAESQGELDDATRDEVKAMSAGTDNVGVFFGEDIFMAIGSILLIVGFLDQNGLIVEPLHLSVWAIPTAICAFLVHGARLLLFDRKLSRRAASMQEKEA